MCPGVVQVLRLRAAALALVPNKVVVVVVSSRIKLYDVDVDDVDVGRRDVVLGARSTVVEIRLKKSSLSLSALDVVEINKVVVDVVGLT